MEVGGGIRHCVGSVGFFFLLCLFGVSNRTVEQPRSRFGHNVRRPTQFVCPNSDTICPNSDSVRPNYDKIYLTVVTFRFLLLFFAY